MTGGIVGGEPVAMIAQRKLSSRSPAPIRPGARNVADSSITSTPAARRRSGESCGAIRAHAADVRYDPGEVDVRLGRSESYPVCVADAVCEIGGGEQALAWHAARP